MACMKQPPPPTQQLAGHIPFEPVNPLSPNCHSSLGPGTLLSICGNAPGSMDKVHEPRYQFTSLLTALALGQILSVFWIH